MTRICLDTSAYSRFKRGEAAAIEVIDEAEWVGVPAVVLGELRTGFLLGRKPPTTSESCWRSSGIP